MTDIAVTVRSIQLRRYSIPGYVPDALARGEPFVNLASGFILVGDGSTAPSALPKIAFKPASDLPLSSAAILAMQALHDSLQPLDPTLTALSGVTVAADTMIYATGLDLFATTALTPLARNVLGQTTQTGMAAAIGVIAATRQVVGGGLATGGGDLSADRTITVPKASQSDVATGTDDAKALTSLSVAAALAGKVGTGRQVVAGTGLTGGGDLTADRTLSLTGIATGRLLANLLGATAAPVATLPSDLLDTFGSARGGLLVRGVSGWSALALGANGYVLQSNGTDTFWAAAAGGTGGVRYDLAQGLTAAQQLQGRLNIAAAGAEDVSALAIQVAKLKGSVLGLYGGIADDFRDQTGYDTANSVGAIWDSTTNTIRNQSIESTESLAAMTSNSAPSGQTAATSGSQSAGYEAYRAFDHSASTYWQVAFSNPTTLTRTFPSQNVSSVALTMRSDSSSHYPTNYTIDLYNGSTWTTVVTRTGDTFATGERRVYAVPSGTYSGCRMTVTASASGTYVDTASFEVLAGTITALDLRSIAFTAQAVPTKGSIFVLVKALVGTITPGTNLTASLSRDGGTTYTAFSLTNTGTIAGYAIYEGNGLDISGQPSGSSMKWRLQTVGTALAVQADAVVAQWG